jgi:hypothetical protein
MTDEEKRANNAEKSRKRRAELEQAAALNGFDNWSAMLTYIKNEAKDGYAAVNVRCGICGERTALVCMNCAPTIPQPA